jgi:hypothetical protein
MIVGGYVMQLYCGNRECQRGFCKQPRQWENANGEQTERQCMKSARAAGWVFINGECYCCKDCQTAQAKDLK